MNILVTGGRGFLGSNIIKKLFLERHNVYLLSKDCNDIKSEIITFSPDIIIHCGWAGGNSYKDINNSNQFSKNINTSIDLVEALKEIPKKTKFIGFGSFAEYGSQNFIINEEIQEHPSDLYGLSKYTFKKYSQLVCNQHNIDWFNLSINPNPEAIKLLKANQHKIDWYLLSRNRNPEAIKLLNTKPNEIDWDELSANPAIFDEVLE